MDNPTQILIELHRNILETCDSLAVKPSDLCVMARPKMIDALKKLDGFPALATCKNPDIPEKVNGDGMYQSVVYVTLKSHIASYGLVYDA